MIELRNKRIKPLFDDKSQTDQNAFLLEVLMHASIVLEDESLKTETLNSFKILQEKLKIPVSFLSDANFEMI